MFAMPVIATVPPSTRMDVGVSRIALGRNCAGRSRAVRCSIIYLVNHITENGGGSAARPFDRGAAGPGPRRVESRVAARCEPARVLAAAAADEFPSRREGARSHGVTELTIEALLERARAGLARVGPAHAEA